MTIEIKRTAEETTIELVGRLEILVLCFPLIEKLLASVKEVMSWA